MAAPTRPRTNRRVVYETLRRKVLTLEFPPGTALSENELAAALGVSRTPVRESLILLVEEGLVQVFPQVGSFVSRVDPDRVRDAQFLREAVELAALDDVPAELDAAVLAELRENLDRQRAPGLGLEEKNSTEPFAAQHQEIFDAGVDRDLPRARDTMRTHLRAVFADVEQVRRHSPELFAAADGTVPVRRNVVVWE